MDKIILILFFIYFIYFGNEEIWLCRNLIFQILNVKKVGIGRKNVDAKLPGHLKSFLILHKFTTL